MFYLLLHRYTYASMFSAVLAHLCKVERAVVVTDVVVGLSVGIGHILKFNVKVFFK